MPARSAGLVGAAAAYKDKHEQVLRIAASDVAAVAGYHDWVDVRELFLERLLYQVCLTRQTRAYVHTTSSSATRTCDVVLFRCTLLLVACMHCRLQRLWRRRPQEAVYSTSARVFFSLPAWVVLLSAWTSITTVFDRNLFLESQSN